MAHLEGKVLWMMIGSFFAVAMLGARGILPGTGGRS